MLEMHLAGMSQKAIAEALGCTPQSVGIVMRSALFRAEYNRRLKEQTGGAIADEVDAFASKARMTLEKNAEKAAETQVELMEDSLDDSVKLRAAGSILDRVLGKAEGREASGGPQVKIEINAQDAKLLVTALNESKEISNGEVQDAAADSSAAGPSEDGQGDVHQTPQLGSGE
jgi:hypothetical protein